MTPTEAELREAVLLLAASWEAIAWDEQTRGHPRVAQALRRAAADARAALTRT